MLALFHGPPWLAFLMVLPGWRSSWSSLTGFLIHTKHSSNDQHVQLAMYCTFENSVSNGSNYHRHQRRRSWWHNVFAQWALGVPSRRIGSRYKPFLDAFSVEAVKTGQKLHFLSVVVWFLRPLYTWHQNIYLWGSICGFKMAHTLYIVVLVFAWKKSMWSRINSEITDNRSC